MADVTKTAFMTGQAYLIAHVALALFMTVHHASSLHAAHRIPNVPIITESVETIYATSHLNFVSISASQIKTASIRPLPASPTVTVLLAAMTIPSAQLQDTFVETKSAMTFQENAT